MLFRQSPSGKYIDIPLAGNLDVANIAALALLPDDSDTPDWVWVSSATSVGCYWHRNVDSTLVPDGITVVAAIGGGRWERCVPSTSPVWLVQATWYVNPLIGNDEAGGGILAPLRTVAELNRRLSVGPIGQATTVWIIGSAVMPEAHLAVDTDGYLFTVRGLLTASGTGSIGTWTTRNHATPEATLITDPVVGDWTPYEGSRIDITSGASVGAVGWVAAANPHGAGLQVAATDIFGSPPTSGNAYRPAILPLANGNTYTRRELAAFPVVNSLALTQRPGRGPRSVNDQQAFWVQDLMIGGVTQARFSVETMPTFGAIVDGCIIDIVGLRTRTQNCNFTRCKLGGGSAIATIPRGVGNFRDCLLFKSLQIASEDKMTVDRCLSWGVAGAAGAFTQTLSETLLIQLKFQDTQIFNAVGPAIDFLASGVIWTQEGLSGDGNTIGLRVNDPDNDCIGQQSFLWAEAADLPNLRGTDVAGITRDIDVRSAGPTDIYLAWTAPGAGEGVVPFADNRQEGSATLDAGTITIPARFATVQGVQCIKTNPLGTPQGVLVVTAASATDFTVQARDLATGALVATDVSVFHWSVAGFARMLRICQASGINAPPGVA